MTRLPSKWIDSLFTRLSVRYGQQWQAKWTGIDPELVKDDWAAELGCFSEKPAAIAYGLDNLPADFPPTVAQFKAICIGRPEPSLPALPAPKTDPARVAAAIQRAANAQRMQDPKAWAHRLRVREQQLDRLTPAQRTMWRAAIGNVVEAA